MIAHFPGVTLQLAGSDELSMNYFYQSNRYTMTEWIHPEFD